MSHRRTLSAVPSITTPVRESNIEKCRKGMYLEKLGAKVKNWKRRYVVLDGCSRILYFENDDAFAKNMPALGTISLAQHPGTIVLSGFSVEKSRENTVFGIQTFEEPTPTSESARTSRLYVIDAGSMETKKMWLSALRHVTLQVDRKYGQLDVLLEDAWQKEDFAAYEDAVNKWIHQHPQEATLRFKKALMYLHPRSSAFVLSSPSSRSSMVLNSQTTMQESYVLEHELLAASIATHSVRQSIGNKRGSLFSEILSSTSDECSATTGMPAWDRCRVLLDEALSLDGDLACAYGVMGLTYLQQYQRDPSVDASSRVDLLQKAKQQFEIALRLIPSEYHALLGYAELLSLRQEDDAAERMFSRANSIYPQDANILELMGNHYLSRKKWKEAAKAYSQHIQACVQSFGPETHQSAKRTPFAPVAPDTPVLSFAASEDEEGYADAQNALVALQQGLVSPDLLYRRGLARAGMRLFREAAQDFSKCLSALEPLYGASDVETITVNGMSFYPALLQIQYDYICALFAGGLYAECVKELSRVDWQSFVDRSTVMHMLVTSFKNLDDKANMSRVLLWDFHQLWMQNPVRDVHDIGELRSARQFSDLSYSSSVILALFSGHPQSLLQVKDQIPEADILLGNYDAAMSRNERALDMFVYHSARYRLRKWLHQSGVSDDPTAEDMIIASLDPLSEKRLIETFLWQPPSEIVSYSRARFGRDSLEHRTWFFLHALSRLRAGDDSPMLQLDQLIATGNEDAVVEWTACRMALLADNDFRTGKKDEAFSVLAKALDMVFFAFPPFFVLRASWYFSDLNFRECYSNCILALKLNDQDVSARLLAAKSALKFTTEDQVIRRYADELLVVSTELPTCSAVQAILGDVFSKLGSIEKAKYHWEQALSLELDFYRHWRGTGPDSADVHEYSTKLASAMASTGDVAGAERYRVIADSWVGTIPSG